MSLITYQSYLGTWKSKVCWLSWIFNSQSPDLEPARHLWEYLIPENVAQAEQAVMLIQHYRDHYQTSFYSHKDPLTPLPQVSLINKQHIFWISLNVSRQNSKFNAHLVYRCPPRFLNHVIAGGSMFAHQNAPQNIQNVIFLEASHNIAFRCRQN